ncbi:MAG: hypothetical protein AVDCRST_MAG93-8705, partial [uncultured Chloroflexia bacterium]
WLCCRQANRQSPRPQSCQAPSPRSGAIGISSACGRLGYCFYHSGTGCRSSFPGAYGGS